MLPSSARRNNVLTYLHFVAADVILHLLCNTVLWGLRSRSDNEALRKYKKSENRATAECDRAKTGSRSTT